ncbi:MAG: hypothetical protein GF363_12220 [Chitinivibrionales bacterium]|nr:hypothetical protein [Chitinivibrionales bacterium]
MGSKVYPPDIVGTGDTLGLIMKVGKKGIDVAGFRIVDGVVEELVNAAPEEWKPMRVGEDTIRVNESVRHGFYFSADRRRISPIIPLATSYNGRLYSIPSRGGQFRCRN